MKILLLLIMSFTTFADDFKAVEDKLKTALKSEVRTDKDKERDRNRRPISTLKFMGLKDDMKVVELLPGGGWYTKLLAPTLKEKGELYLAYGAGRVEKSLIEKNQDFSHVSVVAKESKLYRKDGAKFYSLENADLGLEKMDMVLTFRNYHNFDFEGRKAMNDAAWKALKVGGVYGVVDHTRRHMQADDSENRRRIDPVLSIKEIQDAGFIFVDYSDLHYRLDDELRYEVGRKSVSGNTDRFTFKFIKVKK
ncbi:MAG: class I SAM-dependent methyltransferase [Alcanivoracaceae bacterium]|nr:class I SAM-dependent methyltransferase [Alcanivoracaceae bacterium]